MNSTVRQARSLIFFLCAGIALSLAQATFLRGPASHDHNDMLACGLAGHSQRLPALEQNQIDCANARPTFQGSVILASGRAIAPWGELAEVVVFDKSYRLQSEPLRAHFGRAPPYPFSR